MIYVCRTQLYHIFSRSSLQPHRLPTDLAMLVHWPAMPLHSFSLSWLQFTWQVYRAYSSSLCKAEPWGIRMFLKKRIEHCVLALFAKLAVVFILTCICMERTNSSYIPPSSHQMRSGVTCPSWVLCTMLWNRGNHISQLKGNNSSCQVQWSAAGQHL